ncbi:MAG: hypothetical protein K0Q50_1292 [Vampirovibrio sp.]|nr:hypothetical protein [Vampirovibrio sp.]
MRMQVSGLSHRATAQNANSARPKQPATPVRFGHREDELELSRLTSSAAKERVDTGKTPEGRLSHQQQIEKWERERERGWARAAEQYKGHTDQYKKTLADYNRELDTTADEGEQLQIIQRRAELRASIFRHNNNPAKRPSVFKRLGSLWQSKDGK